MTIYRIDVQVAGTAYIKADSEEEARTKAAGLKDMYIEIPLLGGKSVPAGDVIVSGQTFEDPDLPEVSLSPMFTIHGAWPGVEIEEV